VVDHCRAVAADDHQYPLDGIGGQVVGADGPDDGVGHPLDQAVLGLDVPADGVQVRAKRAGDSPQRQPFEPFGFEGRERGSDDQETWRRCSSELQSTHSE
jgi:hypothetical protein